MLDQIRPALSPTAEIRRRSDGTEGIYAPETGLCFETTKEQANLVQLFDGQRSLLEISAEYLNRFGFVPFAALNDLVHGLADAGVLRDTPPQLSQSNDSSSPWLEALMPSTLAAWRDRWPRVLRVLELAIWPALAISGCQGGEPHELRALDVVLAYAGAVAALTLRGRMKAAAAAAFGFSPRRATLTATLGVLHVVPDTGVIVLMDRWQRVAANVAALAGIVCALAIAAPWPGAWGGALIVLVIDVCPVLRSSVSEIITAWSGEVNVRARVRAYVGVPLLEKLVSGRLVRSDRVFFVSAVSTLTWVALVIYVLLGLGLSTALAFIAIGVRDTGATQALAWVGGGALIAIIPVPIIILSHQLIDFAFAAFWPYVSGGKRTKGAADVQLFRAIPLFSKLAEGDLAAVAAQASEVSYDAGHLIVEEGAVGQTFYAIRHGWAEVTRNENGSLRTLARLGPGDCFGETALLQGGARNASVRALSQLDLVELPSAAFKRIVATVGGVDFVTVLQSAGAIGKSRLFRELPADRLSSLATKFMPRSVPTGTDVVRFGEPGTEFFLIAKGEVEVLSGDGVRLTVLSSGDHFGEIALLRSVPRTATVRTVSDTLLLVLSRDVFLQALQADLTLSEKVTEVAEARTARSTAMAAG
ncbi:MAG: cyclic nucleotide-binding domain-containing protein [Archangium sp.]|nr:cyclic nucleotide-binding domain-containing protein [Archangium sp.]